MKYYYSESLGALPVPKFQTNTPKGFDSPEEAHIEWYKQKRLKLQEKIESNNRLLELSKVQLKKFEDEHQTLKDDYPEYFV